MDPLGSHSAPFRGILEQFQRGELTLAQAEQQLQAGPPHTFRTADAAVDLDRQRRCGYPEVVYGRGKTTAAIADIFAALVVANQEAFATLVSDEQARELLMRFPAARHNPVARTLRLSPAGATAVASRGRVAVLTAGTSDRPVAEEALETILWMGCSAELIVDVGVAGPQRLLSQRARFVDADAVVVVAGMEGALPSVVGGYVKCPVVAVPTSVGYGASFGGIAALLGMLNSCASNVTVVNIDSGFKGGYIAGLIAQRSAPQA